MYDGNLAKEILSQILNALDTIIYRFEPVKSLTDLTDSPSGMEKLDSICMQLIAIGEGLKNFDKITNNSLLRHYPEVNWKGAKAMRDIISHHYFEIDAEIIFEVCQNKIKPLRDTIEKILNSL
ncbi:MAG: HepT-like ribonuclease domain-containing protein [Desulfobacterales bacterium]